MKHRKGSSRVVPSREGRWVGLCLSLWSVGWGSIVSVGCSSSGSSDVSSGGADSATGNTGAGRTSAGAAASGGGAAASGGGAAGTGATGASAGSVTGAGATGGGASAGNAITGGAASGAGGSGSRDGGGSIGTAGGATTGGATAASDGGARGADGGAGRGGTSGGGDGGAQTGTGGVARDGGVSRDAGTGGQTTGSTGQTNLPAGVTALFPPPGGQGLCPDPPLRITFSGPPTLGTTGKIQVFNAAQPGTAVATVDMAQTSATDTIGGTTFNMVRPVYVDGNEAVIYLRSHALSYGQTYYVTVDSGAIAGPGGAALAITGTTAWRFGTAAAAPGDLSSLAVALDGSGEFCSVQGAVDALPARNNAAARITIAPGTYHEIVHFTQKNNVTLHGADRKGTIIAGTNNNNMNPSTATRSLVGIDNSTGLVVENLTIHNLTPQGGSQAEALRLQSCDMCVVRDADISSLQDTLLFSGRIYVDGCYIAGNVDFVWGTGTAYFNNCEIKTVVRAGADVQARNPASTYGYVFVDSKLTSDPGITGTTLARIDVGTYPASHVAYINCQMGSHIAPAGWQITAGTDTSMLRFWEYQSKDPAGNPIDVSRRLAGSVQLSASQAAMMRDPTVVLRGWQPPAN